MSAPKKLPSIQTADGIATKIGMPIYYVQECCRSNVPFRVDCGEIIDLDLGRKREVRIRKTNGREVVLGMSTNRLLCSADGGINREVIFARKSKAIALAKELSAPKLNALEKDVEQAKRDTAKKQVLEQASYDVGLRWAKRDLDDATKQLADYKSKLRDIGK